MIKQRQIGHDKNIFLLSGAFLLERLTYYGIRSIIVFHLMNEHIGMSRSESIEFYGTLSFTVILSSILGGVLSDFLINKKRLIQFSLIIQLIGLILFGFEISTFAGLLLFSIGSGSYGTVNWSYLGMKYQTKDKILPSAISIFYIAINLGAFLGVLFMYDIYLKNGINACIIVGTLLLLGSILCSSFIDQDKKIKFNIKAKSLKVTIPFVAILLISSVIFWSSYELLAIKEAALQYDEIMNQFFEFNSYKNQFVSGFLSIITLVAVALIWRYKPLNKTLGISIGILLFFISICCAILISSSIEKVPLIIAITIFLAFAEILFSVSFLSLLFKYCNPKLYGTIIAATFFNLAIIGKIIGSTYNLKNINTVLVVSAVIILQLLIGFILFYIFRKKEVIE